MAGASESDQERTEEASEQKRSTTHDEGRVPRSQELTVAAMLLGSALVFNTAGAPLGSYMASTMSSMLTSAGTTSLDAGAATDLIRQLGFSTLKVLGTFLGAMALVALSITAIQARGVLSLHPITPNFGKLNPMQNAKRVFGTQSLIELAKSLGKVGIVSGVVYSVIGALIPEALDLAQSGPSQLLPMVKGYALRLLTSAGIAYVVLAAGDYLWQWWSFEKELRMSKEEVKQENKQQNGDPHVKSRRRQIARSYAPAR
jgi:flagellar biosynthesis protein FlhB